MFPKMLQRLIFLAAFSLIITIPLPYVGEEGVYTITTLEMLFNQEWLAPTLYGANYGRPPLFNWFIIPIVQLLGLDHILWASRIVAITATLCTALCLKWFVQKITQDRTLSLLSTLIFLSGDLLLRRGWIAYADPLFSLFVFVAMITLWLALEEEKISWLFVSCFALFASFLTKALTGYVFYAFTYIALIGLHPNRHFLMRRGIIALHGLFLLLPIGWNILNRPADGVGMITDITSRFLNSESHFSLTQYLKHFISFPFDLFIIRFLPVSFIIVWFFIKPFFVKLFFVKHYFAKNTAYLNYPNYYLHYPNAHYKTLTKILALIIFLNIIPYWLSKDTRIRYLLPLYPWISFLFSIILCTLGKKSENSENSENLVNSEKSTRNFVPANCAITSLCGGIILNLIIVLYGAFNQNEYQVVAKEIYHITKDKTIYADDYSATGLSVAANLNGLRLWNAPLTRLPGPTQNAYIIAQNKNYPNTKIVKEFTIKKNKLFLLLHE